MGLRPLETAPTFPADALHQALNTIPDGAWGQASTLEQSGTHHGYRVLSLIQPGRREPHADMFAFVLDEFAPVHQAWLSSLEPDGFILPHLDAGPYHERWQVPIVAGSLNGSQAVAGVAFRVQHWEPHSVTNEAGHSRVHIVIDRAVIVNSASVPFQRVEVKS